MHNHESSHNIRFTFRALKPDRVIGAKALLKIGAQQQIRSNLSCILMFFSVFVLVVWPGKAYAEILNFIISDGMIFRLDYPDQKIKLGERLNLKLLGRRFPESKVRTVYEQGDEEYLYHEISHGNIVIQINYNDRDIVTSIESSSIGVRDINGAGIGDSLNKTLGKRAYCNTFMEDEMPYCSMNKGRGIRYDVEIPDGCKLPQHKEGYFNIPACIKISKISTQN